MNGDIRRVAVVGTGVIGASWSALFLARGLDVIAVDPAAGAEQALHHYIANAWPAMKALGQVLPSGSPGRRGISTASMRRPVTRRAVSITSRTECPRPVPTF